MWDEQRRFSDFAGTLHSLSCFPVCSHLRTSRGVPGASYLLFKIFLPPRPVMVIVVEVEEEGVFFDMDEKVQTVEYSLFGQNEPYRN